MAKILRKNKSLTIKKNLLIFFSFTSVGVCIEMFIYKQYIISIIMFLISIFLSSKAIIYANGAQGEASILKVIKKLPKNYVIINDIKIQVDARTSQIDHIILCNNGIFCVETKNHRGEIYSTDNDKWIQIKQSQKGIKHKNYFYNPVRQVMGQVYSLKSVLEKEGISNLFIQPIVVFSCDDVKLNVESNIPVITKREIYQYILNYKKVVYNGKHEISEEMIKNISEIITKNNISRIEFR